MTWTHVVNALAVVGAISLLGSAAIVVVGLLLDRNALNRHSSHR